MNLKESIIKDSINYKGGNFSDNYFFSKLSEGFVADYKILGEDAIEMYSEIFGEEYAPIFESMSENINVLSEAVESKATALIFEAPDTMKFPSEKKGFDQRYRQTPHMGTSIYQDGASGKMFSDEGAAAKAEKLGAAKMLSDPNFGKKGGLAGIWQSIKEWGKGLASKFPGVSAFIGKGISWITGHPPAVLGTAGGAALRAGIVRALKKRGDTKKAAALQAKIDDAAKSGAKGAAAVAEKK